VIGGDFQGLGVARSLGRRGVPVFVIDDEHSISRCSVYTTRALRVPDLRDERRTVGALLDAGRRHRLEGWVLFPTRDETVAALSRYRDALSESFRVPTPGWSSVEWAWDKRRTYERALELGVPTPRTWCLQDASELDRVDGRPPFVVKPAIKEHFIYATKAKAWRADSRAELAARYAAAARVVPPGEAMVQELIPGDGREQLSFCAFFKEGRALGSMVACRRRQHPPQFGRASTYVETVDVPELEELSLRFLRSIDYYGLVEVEYKRDARDGEYKLLDVNARTWGYHSLGERAGVDFPYLLYADQLSLATDPCRAQVGVRWMRLMTDVLTAAAEIADGRLDLRSYLASLRSFDTEAVFSLDDPLPALAELMLVPYLAVKRGF
jgi:predicted ATP-grasp superfamily ATP-dependent carboligase